MLRQTAKVTNHAVKVLVTRRRHCCGDRDEKRMRRILLLALMARFCAAQTIEVESLFQPAPLSGTWKHHTGDDPRWADPAFDDSAWPTVSMPEAADQPTLGFSWYRFRVRLPENMPKEPLALMIGGFGREQAYDVFWNGQRAGARGEVDGGVWGLRISIPKSIPVQGHGREAVVAIRLRASRMLSVFTYDKGNSWLGTEASIQGQIETWRGERLLNAQPLLLISASLLLCAALFLLLPLWRRDAPEYFWFGLWLLFGTINRISLPTPDVVGLEGGLAAVWIRSVTGAALGLSWLGWMRSLFLSRITQAVWLATAGASALQLGMGAFSTAGGNSPPPWVFAEHADCLLPGFHLLPARVAKLARSGSHSLRSHRDPGLPRGALCHLRSRVLLTDQCNGHPGVIGAHYHRADVPASVMSNK